MTKSMFLIAIGAITPLVLADKGYAQTACYEALIDAETVLEADRDVTAKGLIRNNWYEDRPISRPHAYSFSLSGSDVLDVMNSPQLFTSITENIIQSCETISIVQFGVENSSYVDTYGLMGDGSVALFQCQDPSSPLAHVWGNIGCT